jgi:hypothetical protein
MTLSLLKIGMLDFMAMGVSPPYCTALGRIGSGCLSPGFPWWDRPSGAGKFSEVVLQGEACI